MQSILGDILAGSSNNLTYDFYAKIKFPEKSS